MSNTEVCLRDVTFQENYSTSGASMLHEFYAPALSHAIQYDRAAGYFSSAILALAPAVFSEFVERGGKMRLLCSPNLSEADAEAVLALPESHRPTPVEVAATSLAALAHGTHVQSRAVACMRALIDSGVLEVQFVTVGASGLYHEKIGVFTDTQGNRLSFSGSANETASAWSGLANHEGIEVFPEWLGESEERRCSRHSDQFDETWMGLRRNLRVTSVDQASRVIREYVPAEPLAEIVESLRRALTDAELHPKTISLRPYQAQVLDSWERAGRRGIVAFATGGGKTRTALEAIRRWTADGKPALVMVPSELLHRQWTAEITEMLGAPAMLLAGAGHGRDGWSSRLADYTRDDSSLGQRVILSTYQTAATSRFLELAHGGEHLLVVGDEVHSVGAPDTRRVLERIASGARLGLSATPQRYGDPTGTAAIFEYFGDILVPEFTLRDALDAAVLVPYDYDFVTCALTEDEQVAWDELTERVAKEIARHDGDLSEHALHLLRQRARISKGAHNKATIARDLVAKNYRTGDRWLVYCSDVNHLREVREQLGGLGLELLEYHSQDDGDHKATLDFFSNRGGILLAIKCLDEGIDIPMINRALILASSTNPREYVQRRGRVLRRSPGKYSSHLFDVIVIGTDGKAIAPSEVIRAKEFARDSRNIGPELYLDDLLPAGMISGELDVEED
ncbi:DEAD/DEAH box helicase family protein [Demequina activiva]|uniref:DNA-repair protein n=1 Tax=Demequina activiva TaxID=1582364 RepID=A0A919Q2Q3_9MICO|nr:DEAD/DEAH box helicase family protein [Demequina activiva]GIG53333.1 DNA-repair protein [Demequina activiva]